MIAQEELKNLLQYAPTTGIFTWVVPRQGVKFGGIAGHLGGDGYVYITINGKLCRAHRLVWLYAHGSFPAQQIDHINGDRADNRLCNLREATNSENGYNKGKRSNNTSGFKGVSWDKPTKKWLARCGVSGKQVYLGLYTTAEAANAAYQTFAKENHGAFYNSGDIM